MIFASFHYKGKIPYCSDMLNMCASGVLTCSIVSFSIVGDIHGAKYHSPQYNKTAKLLSVDMTLWCHHRAVTAIQL